MSKIYVGYRDNKLTEILSECLGGNSKTYIFACISPFNANCEESLSTLLFASRAKIIKTQAQKNEKVATLNNKNKVNVENIDDNYVPSKSSYKNANKGESNFNKMKNHSKNFVNQKSQNNNKIFPQKSINFRDELMNKRGCFLRLPQENNKSKCYDDEDIKKENFKMITKKFYGIILHLQDELGKLIIQNYSLEQENNYLKEQLNNIS